MSEGPQTPQGYPGPEGSMRITLDVARYLAARLLLVVALSATIYGVARLLGVTDFPLVIAVLFALVIAMPLGIWVLSPWRRRATAGLDRASERRRHERAQLQARLRGELPPDQQ